MTKATRSIYVEAREWFDKSGGNSYYSARIYVDGQRVYTTGMSYGYDYQFEYDTARFLAERGYIPEGYGSRSIRWARELGLDVYTVKYDSKKRELWEREVAE